YPGSGIDRHVWLIVTGKIHVARDGIYLTTPEVTAQQARVKIETRVRNESNQDCSIHLITEMFDPKGNKISTLDHDDNINAGAADQYGQTAEIASPEPWPPDSPS